ncbi:MAG: phosphoribosylaminoimidazolesuccinocarboxamide synthase [Candidatus Bathyarchaeia archaeon]
MIVKELVYRGKSKDVYRRDDGNLEFYFKDAVTGTIGDNGQLILDPGFDTVAGEIPGKGRVSCAFSTHFFKLFTQKGVPNHYIETVDERTMVVEPAELIRVQGLYNLEFIYRNNAHGGFLRRYPFVPFCRNLHGLIETTTKGAIDHLITDDALVELGIMSREELRYAKSLIRRISKIVREELSRKNLHLIDGKIELGRIRGQIKLIDDISPDVMRVCRGAELDEGGNCPVNCKGENVLSPLELYEAVFV